MIIYRPRHRRRGAATQAPLGSITDHVTTVLSSALQPIRRVSPVGQGTGNTNQNIKVAGVGEGLTATSATGIPVIVAYTATTYGAAGAPQSGHDMVTIRLADGAEAILGHIPH